MRHTGRKKLIGVKRTDYNDLRKWTKTLNTFMPPYFREETLTGLSCLKRKGKDDVKIVRGLWKKYLIIIPNCSQVRIHITEKISSMAFL